MQPFELIDRSQMYVLLCDAWVPTNSDKALIGFDTPEEVETWKKEADKLCSGNHYIIQVIPEREAR